MNWVSIVVEYWLIIGMILFLISFFIFSYIYSNSVRNDAIVSTKDAGYVTDGTYRYAQTKHDIDLTHIKTTTNMYRIAGIKPAITWNTKVTFNINGANQRFLIFADEPNVRYYIQ